MGSRNAYLQVTSSLLQKNPPSSDILHLLVRLVVVDAGAVRRGLGLALLILGAHVLLEDGLRLVDLKFGLEIINVARQATAIGAAAGIVEVEVFVHHLVTSIAPVSPTTAILLGLLGVGISKAVLGEELGQRFMRQDGAVGQAGVVLVVELVRTSHLDGWTVVDERVEGSCRGMFLEYGVSESS
jgi:hypothetical protein